MTIGIFLQTQIHRDLIRYVEDRYNRQMKNLELLSRKHFLIVSYLEKMTCIWLHISLSAES